MSHSEIGSLWHRWDLHFHTPSSFDYHNKAVTNEQIVDELLRHNIRVVAVTDHHTMDIPRIRDLQRLGAGKLTVLPGIELRGDHGGKPINYICIFSEHADLDHIWTTLQGSLGLTPIDIAKKGGDHKVYVPIENAAAKTQELGGVISIHAGGKSNSIEGIGNYEQFQQRIKYDITKQYVDIMEVGQLKDVDVHLNMIFPSTGLEKPLIICSDNHDIFDYRVKVPLWLRADPTFRGLLMVLREPQDRVYLGAKPPSQQRVEQNRTKYIRRIAFERKDHCPASEMWFSGDVAFNPGLVAIVGNKGTGKSALADTLGLLGSSKKSSSFSFLSKERFRHPSSGLAHCFDASIEWESGELQTKSLADDIKPEEIERLKYLPQDHVEDVCNELAGTGTGGFERELKSVIFSHVPEAQRLGHTSLDDLVRFQTGEKQKRIDSLVRQLKESSRLRAALESQADPLVKRELQEKIAQRELELRIHDEAKPPAEDDPSLKQGEAASDPHLISQLAEAEAERASLNEQIVAALEALRAAERRQAVAKRLIEKLDNYKKDFDLFKSEVQTEATEIGLTADELLTFVIQKQPAERIRDEAATVIITTEQRLNGDDPPGLRKRLLAVEARIASFQSNLDAPQRRYQAYLKALGEWSKRRLVIVGDVSDAESIEGLKAALATLDQLPEKVTIATADQVRIAMEIHAEKLSQAVIYRELYGSVQNFIDTHSLAKEKLKLEFRAELSTEDFSERLLGLLLLNRRGSFIGAVDGRVRADGLVESVKWEDAESVKSFLTKVNHALHHDLRDATAPEVQLKSQLGKGKKLEDVYDLIYGLEYVRPRYILRWEGKDLSILSPGERGTLLLVFYLLIDQSDLPLLIDQPEGNLDNHTVAKVLCECLKEARKKRQVFIVTHNPNLAVVCDADQVVHATMDKSNGNGITYTTGALENPAMSRYVTDVLEGTRWAFSVRGSKYQVSD